MREFKAKGLRCAAAALVVLACNETPPPPSPCPPGSARADGACVAVRERSSVSPLASGSVSKVRPSPAHRVIPGPAALALDPAQLRAGDAFLAEFAASRIGDAVAQGELVAGQFAEGESMVATLPARVGACYRAVALGLAPVNRIEIALRAERAPGFGARVESPRGAEPKAVLGAGEDCLDFEREKPTEMQLVLTVTSGQGVALARVYVKR